MANITDKQMNVKSADKDIWLNQVAIWGHGSLIARITKSGERLFYFRYQNEQGERVTYPIGTYSRSGSDGTMTLAEATQKATYLAGLHKSGIRNIKEHLEAEELARTKTRDAEIARLDREKAEADAEAARLASRLTVSQLFERWTQLEISQRKDGGSEVRRMFEKDVLPSLGHLYVADVQKSHITEITDQLMARGVNRMSKVIFSLLRQMFNFAIERDYLQINPTATINKSKVFGKDNERDRILNEDEIVMLSKLLPAANLLESTQIALWVCLSTCCRIGEILSAEWRYIDFEKRTWVIPAEHSKNGKPHTVYLSDFTIRQFKRLHQIKEHDTWCYPNRSKTGAVTTKTVTKQVGDRQRENDAQVIHGRTKSFDALKLIGGYWTPHDLRRTGASMMVRLGVTPDVADRCLNHTEQSKLKRIYIVYDYADEMREAWDLLGNKLDILISK
ncbi:site-specific integrase [Acinetobacter populi]|uniref:Integrase n=1 Tax=Acinetobacter populi TaxID=1582270 RepID=A0A1Z9Z280_9GAMM|nr:site-specific integrase [Acinetobacter populi]OUY08527.1 integrase [Acinetobacter populi]